jgi:hypothetical protein
MGRSILESKLALFLVVAAVSACQGTTPTPSPSPTPAPTATPSPTPSPTPTETASPTPTLDPNATPTPLPTGAAGAFFAVKNYEDALLAGDYAKAWALLSKSTQSLARWGTLNGFQKERAAFLTTAGESYREELSPTNTLTLKQWIEGVGWASKIDQAHAYLISVKWTSFVSPYAGWEIWVASPTKTGWLLYLVR